MKKIVLFTISIILLIYINACTGYVPIYSTSNFNFKIESYSIKGEERLAKLIYQKLYNTSRKYKNDQTNKSINISIETIKERKATVKNNAGKVLEYKINLNTKIIVNDYLTDTQILNQDFNYSVSYKVQDEHTETIRLENKNIENLVNKTYQDALIKISDSIK